MIATAQPPIEEIVRTIVKSVHPRRVVLFGSRARGDARPDSDVDLMVEIDEEPDTRGRAHAIADLFRGGKWSVDVKVYTAPAFALLVDDPGSTVYDIARQGKVLYSRDGPEPRQRAVVRERRGPPHSLAGWLHTAEEDLACVEILTQGERAPWGGICFHAQQAAEKYLKSVLISGWRRPEHTHDLTTLLRACRVAGYSFPGLDDDCALLSRYAVMPRYPSDVFDQTPAPMATPIEGQAAVAACHRIVAAARQHLALPAP